MVCVYVCLWHILAAYTHTPPNFNKTFTLLSLHIQAIELMVSGICSVHPRRWRNASWLCRRLNTVQFCCVTILRQWQTNWRILGWTVMRSSVMCRHRYVYVQQSINTHFLFYELFKWETKKKSNKIQLVSLRNDYGSIKIQKMSE